MKKIIVSSVGVETHDRLILQLVLSIFQSDTVDAWEYQDDNLFADILFVDLDNSGGVIQDELSNGQFHVNMSVDKQNDELNVCLLKPLRVPEVRKVLHEITRPEFEVKQQTKTNITHECDLACGISLNTAGLLSELIKVGLNSLCEVTSPACPKIMFSHEVGKFYVDGNLAALEKYRDQAIKDLYIREVEESEWEEKTPWMHSESLELAFWQLAVDLSGDQLISEIADHDQVNLSRWPDFGRLPHSQDMIKLATRLMVAPEKVGDLKADSEFDQRSMIAFINASYLCGWLQKAENSANNQILIKHLGKNTKRSKFLSLIRDKLNMNKPLN